MQRKPLPSLANLAPNQSAIDDLFARADRVRILQCGMRDGVALGGPILAEFEGIEQFALLKDALQIAETDTGFVCMCSGTLAVEFLEGSSNLCTLGYHHYKTLRHPVWTSDVRLKNGPGLAHLLASRGVVGPLSGYYSESEGSPSLATVQNARQQWAERAPSCLAWNLVFFEKHPELALLALRWAYQSVSERCAVLLRWLGFAELGNGWELPEYQLLPERLLRRNNQHAVMDCILAGFKDLILMRGAAIYLYLVLDFIPIEPGVAEAVSPEKLPPGFWDGVGNAIEKGQNRDDFFNHISKIWHVQ